MRTNKVYLLVALVALAATGIASAAGFSSLEERMSQAEFHAAGLDKLSPDELQALDQWLSTHITTTTTYVTPHGSPVFYPKSSDREVVESRIDGKFSGWSGKNTFRLENGQEWTQAESGSMQTGDYDHPKVRIKPMLVGSWLMYVDGCGCSVRVNRTK